MHFDFVQDQLLAVTIGDDESLSVNASLCQFSAEVEIRNCRVVRFNLFGTYFLAGLRILQCHFDCPVNFQCGGHNTSEILLSDCTFEEFVDFEDCYFDSIVILERIVFRRGTNLLGNKGTPVEVTWSTPPKLVEVQGELECSTFRRQGGVS